LSVLVFKLASTVLVSMMPTKSFFYRFLKVLVGVEF